jgi:Rrf2 family nitric oxide-sensitive transcriptional repressor
MKLKLRTDFALRVLLYLSHRGHLKPGASERPVPVDELAGAFDISRDHVVKVVQDLVRHGWAATRAGRGGGVSLAVDPASLSVGAVVAAFEDRAGVLECVASPQVCVLEPGCRLRRKLIEAEAAFYTVLDDVTVADMADTRGRPGGLRNLSFTDN